MYQFDMTTDEVKRARAAARLVTKLTKGEQLNWGLEIGEQLLKGSAFAAKAAGFAPSNQPPTGRKYSEAFRDWKRAMGFPPGKDNEALYDHAIVCARHRGLAEEIIASLDIKHRMEMGIFGLAARVRKKLREFEGLPAKPRPQRRDQMAEVRGALADVREELSAVRSANPFAEWRESPRVVSRMLRRLDRKAAEALGKALLEAGDDDDEGRE